MARVLPEWVAVSLVALLIVGGALHVAASALGPPGGDADIDPDREFIRIQLHPNGSASWSIEYTYRLTGNRSSAFEDLQNDIRANRSRYENSFRRTVGESVGHAENVTGREMAMRDVSVRTRRQQVGSQVGIVTYRFRWTNFSRANESSIRAGDAISGFLLDENARLEIAWPAAYDLRTVSSTSPDERETNAVVWTGPNNFGADEPRVELSRSNESSTANGSTDATASDPDDDRGSTPSGVDGSSQLIDTGSLFGTSAIALAGVVFVLLGSLAWVTTRRDTADGSEVEEAETIPPDLLSNEELVLRTVREHGGRMKQKVLREELEWAAPKTSKVLGDLQDDGEVDVFRLGRENVVTLPDVGLEADTDE